MKITRAKAELIHKASDAYFDAQKTDELTLEINHQECQGKIQEIGLNFKRKRLELVYEIPIKNLLTGFLSSFAAERATTVWQDVTLYSGCFAEYVDLNDEGEVGMLYVPFYVEYE